MVVVVIASTEENSSVERDCWRSGRRDKGTRVVEAVAAEVMVSIDESDDGKEDANTTSGESPRCAPSSHASQSSLALWPRGHPLPTGAGQLHASRRVMPVSPWTASTLHRGLTERGRTASASARSHRCSWPEAPHAPPSISKGPGFHLGVLSSTRVRQIPFPAAPHQGLRVVFRPHISISLITQNPSPASATAQE